MEARREQSVTQETVAKLVMTRRKAQQMRDATVELDESQAQIGAVTAEVEEQLQGAKLEKEITETFAADLGDLQAEALRVTR